MVNVCRGQLAVKWLSMKGTWKGKGAKQPGLMARKEAVKVIAPEWSEKEDAFIREHYRTMGSAFVAEKLGRTRKAVQLHASQIGVSVPRILLVRVA